MVGRCDLGKEVELGEGRLGPNRDGARGNSPEQGDVGTAALNLRRGRPGL